MVLALTNNYENFSFHNFSSFSQNVKLITGIKNRDTFTRTKDNYLRNLHLFNLQQHCFRINIPPAFDSKNHRLFGSYIACSLFD